VQINNVPVRKLSEHKKASKLIPMMTGKEWDDFLESVKKEGVRKPLDINEKYEVLDGRHRLKAAKELEIETLQVINHTFTDDEEIKFIRDTAIERRNLTVEQKLHIVFETEELIKSIYEEGNKKMESTLKKGKESPLSSKEASGNRPHNSDTKIAELTDSSRPQVARLKRIKHENPDLYKEVVDGDKKISTAYKELPKKKDPGGETKSKQKLERGDIDVKEIPSVVEKRMRKQAPAELSKEELDKQWVNARVQTLGTYLMQMGNFVNEIENFDEVVEEAFQTEESFFENSIRVLEEVTDSLKRKGRVE